MIVAVYYLNYVNTPLLFVAFTCSFVAFTLHLQRRKGKDCSFPLHEQTGMYHLKQTSKMKKFKLLPHGWQKAGWIVTGMGAGMMLHPILFKDGNDSGYHFVTSMFAFGSAVWLIGFLILAFTQEQYEDERIRSIRMNTLGIVAIIYAITLILYPTIDFTLIRFTDVDPLHMGIIKGVRNIFLRPIVIYVVLFKFFLWKDNRSLKYEE